MNLIIEAFLSILTLAGYWLVTHGQIDLGAGISLISNVSWLFYANAKNSISIGIVNAVFAMINITILGA